MGTLTISMRATWQPRVPAPNKRHFVVDNMVKFKDGNTRHLISFRFKSAADIAILYNSINYFINADV